MVRKSSNYKQIILLFVNGLMMSFCKTLKNLMEYYDVCVETLTLKQSVAQ